MIRGRGGRGLRGGGLVRVGAAALLVLAGCGNVATDNRSFNDADVAFAQRMIPHHQQTIAMSALAEGRTRNPQVQGLAEDTAAEQRPEIEQMRDWLEDWGENPHPGHDPTLPGVLTADQMDQLAVARGRAWDRLFLTYLIEHHRGAIEMAADEEANGRHPGALELAAEIQATQQAEIQRIEALLDSGG